MGILSGYGEFLSYADLRARYAELPRNSFDYEVVERASSVAVVPYAGTWKDLGTWNTLTEEMADLASGRTVLDEATCPGTHVVNELDLPVVVAGFPTPWWSPPRTASSSARRRSARGSRITFRR